MDEKQLNGLEAIARDAIKVYGDETAGGGEPDYPQWAADLLDLIKAHRACLAHNEMLAAAMRLSARGGAQIELPPLPIHPKTGKPFTHYEASQTQAYASAAVEAAKPHIIAEFFGRPGKPIGQVRWRDGEAIVRWKTKVPPEAGTLLYADVQPQQQASEPAKLMLGGEILKVWDGIEGRKSSFMTNRETSQIIQFTRAILAKHGQPTPCDHVFEARPVDSSLSVTVASGYSEAVCRKCGYRPVPDARIGPITAAPARSPIGGAYQTDEIKPSYHPFRPRAVDTPNPDAVDTRSDGETSRSKTFKGDIVAWLRRRSESYCTIPGKLAGEIADRIEQLERGIRLAQPNEIAIVNQRCTGEAPAEFIERKASELIVAARHLGVVVRIDVEPCQPLAMGNVRMVADVRPARGRS